MRNTGSDNNAHSSASSNRESGDGQQWGLGLEHEFLVASSKDQGALVPELLLSSEKLYMKLMQYEESRSGKSTSFAHSALGQQRMRRSPPFVFANVVRQRYTPGAKTEAEAAGADDRELRDQMFKVHPLLKLFVEHPDLLALPNILPFPNDADDKDFANMDHAVNAWRTEVLSEMFPAADTKGGDSSQSDRAILLSMTDHGMFYPLTMFYTESEVVDFSGRIAVQLGHALGTNIDFAKQGPWEKGETRKRGEQGKKASALKAKSRYILRTYLDDLRSRSKAIREGDVVVSFAFGRPVRQTVPYTPRLTVFSRGEGSEVKTESLISQLADTFRGGVTQIGLSVFSDNINSVMSRTDRSQLWSSTSISDESFIMSSVSLDLPFIEVKSLRHSNVTVGSLIRQLMTVEGRVLEAAAASLDLKDRSPNKSNNKTVNPYIYPYSGIAHLTSPPSLEGSRSSLSAATSSSIPYSFALEDDVASDDIAPQYAGSYHVWITLPHDKNLLKESTVERERVSRAHALMAHRLQWIEPLLMSIMSGDPRAPGKGLIYPRASMRSTMNVLSGYGTTDPASLLHVDLNKAHPTVRASMLRVRVNRYFDTVSDALDAHRAKKEDSTKAKQNKNDDNDNGKMAGGNAGADAPSSAEERSFNLTRPFTEEDAARADLWVKVRGEWGIDRSCMNIARWPPEEDMEMFGATRFVPSAHFMGTDARNRYQSLLHKKGAAYTIHSMNDIRVEECGRILSYPLLPGWKPVWVKLPRAPAPNPNRARSSDGDAAVQNGKGGIKRPPLQLAMHFVKPSSSGQKPPKIVDDAPIDNNRVGRVNPIGFEFRVMDNCPLQDMVHVLRLISLVAASAVHDEAKAFEGDTGRIWNFLRDTRAGDDPSWNEALIRVSTHGSFAELPDAYLKSLNKVCYPLGKPNADDKTKKHKKDDARSAFDVLAELCRRMHQLYRDHPTTEQLQEHGHDGEGGVAFDASLPPSPVNRNFEHWTKAFREVVRLPKKISSKQKMELVSRLSESPGWQADAYNLQSLFHTHVSLKSQPPR